MSSEFMFTADNVNEGKKLLVECDFAFLCFCPMPNIFDKYEIKGCIHEDRPFTHVNSLHIKYCLYNKFNFIVIAEMYSGPPTVATVEDLYFYGIRKIFGIGFVGSLADEFKIGENVYALSTLPEKGTTPHYLDLPEDQHIMNVQDYPRLKSCFVWTTNGFYRQRKEDIEKAKSLKCNVVNMDTSPFYAACQVFNIKAQYFATVSDSYAEKWNNSLSEAVSKSRSIVKDSQDSLIELILNNETNEDITRYTVKLIEILASKDICQSHNLGHFLAVYENAKKAIDYEILTPYQRKAVLLAALLHDIDDRKLFPNSINNQNTRQILFGHSKQFIDLVIEMINLVSSSINGDTLVKEEWKLIPRYADRIEALGITGIERCYQFCNTIQNPIITDKTSRVTTKEELWKVASEERYKEYKGKSDSFIDHFYDKLLRLSVFPIKNKWLVGRGHEEGKIMVDFILKYFSKNVSDKEFIETYIEM